MLKKLDILNLRKQLFNNETSCEKIINDCFNEIEKTKSFNILISCFKEEALKKAKQQDEILKNTKDNDTLPILFGMPFVIKDNMNYKGTITSCASKFLSNYVSPYNATVVEKLLNAGANIIGKANMDEFAMGSSTENSAYGITKNPVDPTRVPGGSSGGSAAAVAANICVASLGTDTGGSIRQPASFCGVVGLKPTYGLVSRYGVVAYASSLDQVGPLTNSVKDSAIVLDVLCGVDNKDSTSNKLANQKKGTYLNNITSNLNGMKIGIAKELFELGMDTDIKNTLDKAITTLEKYGAKTININLEAIDNALPTYYIIACAEAASNLARFDGIKYGVRSIQEKLDEIYTNSRTQGFGSEVKRRIMLGNYVLSSGYADEYYKKAKEMQNNIKNNFYKAFEQCDIIICPVAPTTAFKIGENTNDPLKMYLNDIYTVPVNIAGLPAISVPFGNDKQKLPIGVQLIANKFNETALLNAAFALECDTAENGGDNYEI